MPVVSDADVIIHLAKLRKLPLLRALYERVAIPEYVRQEITSKDDPGIIEEIDTSLVVHPVSYGSRLSNLNSYCQIM